MNAFPAYGQQPCKQNDMFMLLLMMMMFQPGGGCQGQGNDMFMLLLLMMMMGSPVGAPQI